MSEPIDAVDLFAGAGGWDVAARSLRLRVVGLELDAAACATRAAAGHLTVRCDVAAYPTAPFAGIRGLAGSPPCQGFSRAGRRGGIADLERAHQAIHDLACGRDTRAAIGGACSDPRTVLVAEPMRYAADLRPAWVALEQVPDVLPLWRHYAEVLRGWGYSVWCGVLNAADYGVPQTRRRAILIASSVRAVAPPPPTHTQNPAADLFGEALLPWVSMAQALGWGATDRVAPTVTAGEGKTGGAEPFPSQARAALLAARDRGAWALRSGQSIAGQGRAERRPDEPAVTITGRADLCSWVRQRPATTVCATDRIAPPGHRDRTSSGESQYASPDTVRITVQEGAVLQSFPADYPWQGTKTKRFEQIGNAIPPLLAIHVLAAATGIPLTADLEVAA